MNVLHFVVHSDETILVETSVVIMFISTQKYTIGHLMHTMEPAALVMFKTK